MGEASMSPPAAQKKKRGRPRKDTAALEGAAVSAEAPSPAADELVYDNCSELYRQLETDPERPYHVGVHRGAPFDCVILLGISFEFQISHWDPEIRTNNFQEGRIIEIPDRLAGEIEKKARHTHYWCKVVYGTSGEVRGYVKQGEMNTLDPVAARRVKSRPSKKDPKTGLVTHEYRRLWDWLILRKCEGTEMRPNESLLAENAALSKQVEEMRKRLREV